jgi:hypothetical protein
MSIFTGLGAAPANVTVPVTVAAVAGSIGVEAAAGFASDDGDELCSSFVFSFLLHPISSKKLTQSPRSEIQSLRFMIPPFAIYVSKLKF